MEKILQIIPAPANMYIYSTNWCNGQPVYESVCCLALVERYGRNSVEAMTVSKGKGNSIELADPENMVGLVLLDRPRSELPTEREKESHISHKIDGGCIDE